MNSNKIAFILFFSLSIVLSRASLAGPTAEEYVAHIGAEATLVGPSQFKLAGQTVRCGRRPTVIDPTLDDYGAAYPGFLIINPKLIAKVPDSVKLWIYFHECAHQFRGPDEMTADCFAVQRGRRYGWLTPAGLNQVCNFISPAQGDMMHFSGSRRCEAMRKCYVSKKIH